MNRTCKEAEGGVRSGVGVEARVGAGVLGDGAAVAVGAEVAVGGTGVAVRRIGAVAGTAGEQAARLVTRSVRVNSLGIIIIFSL